MTAQSGKIEILVRFGTRLRVKGKAIEWSPSVRQKIESATSKFVAQISDYCASRGVAFPDGVELNFPDGSRQKFSSRSKPPLTKRQKEILHESGRPIFLDFLKSIARSEDESADIEKAKKVYQKMVFGGRPSEKKRAASEFLRRWDNENSIDRESLIPERNIADRADANNLSRAAIGRAQRTRRGICRGIGRSHEDVTERTRQSEKAINRSGRVACIRQARDQPLESDMAKTLPRSRRQSAKFSKASEGMRDSIRGRR